jgi:NAD(P)-dependent dehydrogenase (short-subunit alcohol dehydrogenase family)
MSPLKDRIILVTGASRGIGAASAKVLASAGAHVILTARTQGGLEEVEQAIHEAGGSATIAPLDISKSDSVEPLARAVAERWGRLDGLILNAAQLGDLMPIAHMDPAPFERVMAANVLSTQLLLRAFDALLRASAAGRIIGVTSSVARSPRAYWGAYAASKAAMESLLLTYSDEVSGISNVRVALYNPGRTRTRMRAQAFPGENPDSLPTAESKAAEIAALLINDFFDRIYHDSITTA